MKAYALVIVLLLIIFGGIGWMLFQRFSAFAEIDFSPPPVTIAVSVARLDSWNQSLNAVGTIQAVRGVDLTSQTSGEVIDIRFDSGDTVKQGALLLVLNDEVEQASRQSEEASLELAQVLFDRDSELIEKKSIPQSQFDRSKADLDRARAALLETQARLSNKRISAPFDGSMGIRQVDVGDYVSPGTVIASLQDQSELEIDFTLPARHIPQLKSGLAIDVRVDAFPDRRFKATLRAVDTRVDPNTRNVLLRAQLDESEGLVPGMFAELAVDLGAEQSLVTVPETALTYALQGNRVYVIEATDDNALTATARVVETGAVRNGRVAVIKGLTDGDRVVTVGQNKLYRGVKGVIDEAVQL